MRRPVWFITGGTSGLGAAVTRAALERGFHVAATSRTPDSFESLGLPARDKLLALRLDLSDAASIREAVATAEQHFGRIDVLFNNAGGVTVGAIEELSDELLWAQLQVNVAGPLAVVRAVLPTMRQRARGRILQMSSLGGRTAFPGLGAYHASKFALEGASLALAQEVEPFGICVTVIEPGDFRTPALSPTRLTSSVPLPEYQQTVGVLRRGLAELDGSQPGDPARLAEAIITITELDHPPRQLPLGSDCYDLLRSQLTTQLEQLHTWAELSRSTDFPPQTSPDDARQVGRVPTDVPVHPSATSSPDGAARTESDPE